MVFLRVFVTIILGMVLSFYSFQPSYSQNCPAQAQTAAFLKPYPLLNEWYQFYVAQEDCVTDGKDFFSKLASSETLSTKLNQARITFDQFYGPLYHLLSMDWENMEENESQSLQSDLSIIDQSLTKALSLINRIDQAHFRTLVLLYLQNEFV